MNNQTAAPLQYLLSLPATMSAYFGTLEGYPRPEWFATSDPDDTRLGSGGGTANLLAQAWQQTGPEMAFTEWLQRSRKLIVHGAGHSRRLPAYAAVSKPFIPVPALRGAFGQRFDQTLLDLQLPDYEFVLRAAPSGFTTLITSGDVFLRFGHDLPPLPNVDVLAFGMPVSADIAQHFGVFFTSRRRPGELAFFLQKPSAARIRELTAEDYHALVDTGMWLLSARAVLALMAQCGWDETHQKFAADIPSSYELYAEFGLALGVAPTVPGVHTATLTSSVVELPRPEFYHLGTSRQLIETVGALQERDSRRSDLMVMRVYPNQVLQNALVARPAGPENHTLWVENASLGPGWALAHDHVITNIPENDWNLALEAGVCLDLPPIGETDICVRAYGIDDRFAGQLGVSTTHWLGQSVTQWLAARGLNFNRARLDPDTDIQFAPLFPVLPPQELTAEFIAWITAKIPTENAACADLWLGLPRLSANEISRQMNIPRLIGQQSQHRTTALRNLYSNRHAAVFYRLDLKATARLIAADGQPLPPPPAVTDITTIAQMHDHMWRATVLRERGTADWRNEEQLAFDCLRAAVIDEVRSEPVAPQRNVVDDQIVWGRAPIRFDLAGGWTDTPPYCLQHGGQVVNVAANLNGQPPIQVFARPSNRPDILLRSIDLGVEQRIISYSDLESYGQPGSEFSLAKAALVLAGFLPRFYGRHEYRDLQHQLEAFGGGIEISLLAAVPQGSGLGTSSILAAAVLGVLSELCGLDWSAVTLIQRTLALEQMLTTGGGWQDQAGGITRGIKRVETQPGFAQTPVFHWLPEYLFGPDYANRNILLYYTGLTRLAKNILQEIVRGMFLNASDRLGTLQEIGQNAVFVGNAIQRADYGLLCEAVRRSWQLNCRLDADTNPPAVQHILHTVGDYLEGAKLLGAGGGGYVLMLAKDEEAATRVRQRLAEAPPNPRARFSRFSVSQTGLEITRS